MRVAEHFEDTARAHGYPQGAALEVRASELFDNPAGCEARLAGVPP